VIWFENFSDPPSQSPIWRSFMAALGDVGDCWTAEVAAQKLFSIPPV